MSGTPTTDHRHELCTEVHNSGPFADGRPHCGECGAIPVLVAEIEVVEVRPEPTREDEILEPIAEAIGIVARLANALGGLTLAELEELYGDPLAEIMADAQAWSVR